MPTTSNRSEKLDIRISLEAKQKHTTISQFVLESALDSANSVLAKRTRLGLSTEQWQNLIAAMDAPPRNHSRMARLLNEPSILD